MEGILFYQQFGEHWEQTYAVAENGSFTAFNRIREDIPSSLSNRGDSIKEFRIITGSVSAKSVKMGLAALSKIKRGNKGLPGHLYFFSATVYDADKGDETLNMATLTEEDRAGWLSLFKASMGKPVDSHGKSSRRNKNSSRDDRDQSQNETMDSIQMQHLSHSPGSIAGEKNHNQSQNQTPWKERKEDQRDRNSSLFSPVGIVSPPAGRRINAPRMQSNVNFHSTLEHAQDQTENEKEQSDAFDEATLELMADGKVDSEAEFRLYLGIGSIKLSNLWRFTQVLLGFPFIIALEAFDPQQEWLWLHNRLAIWTLNALYVFAAPLLVIQFLLPSSSFNEPWHQRLIIGLTFVFLYAIPLAFVYTNKLKAEFFGRDVVEGNFSFKPSASLKLTFSNFLQFVGFFFEWFQLVVMALPVGLYSSTTSVKISSYFPYIGYEYWLYGSAAFCYSGALIIMLPAVLRGKALYRYLYSSAPWHLLFLIGNVLYLPIVVIFFMSLWCNYDTGTDTGSRSGKAMFYQDTSLECWTGDHMLYARLGFCSLGFMVIQHILVPAGAFKETISNDLDIVFTPNYLSLQALLRTLFGGVYVLTYQDDMYRVPSLTVLAILMLLLNSSTSPCSVRSVNLLRDVIYLHATITGILSLVYIVYARLYLGNVYNGESRVLFLGSLVCMIALSTIGMIMYYCFSFSHQKTENCVASNFVEIENSRGGEGIGSRAMEPLISMSFSEEKREVAAGKKYVPTLISLITHKSPRVQFQAIWALSCLAMQDESFRTMIHDGGGTMLILNNFETFPYVCQLEALAALANITLSGNVAESIARQFNCIPFLLNLINSPQAKHSLFALICLCNLTRREMFRERIRCSNGIQTLVTCLMSHDYFKRKFGALALSNMALSVSEELDNVFKTRGLIDRIVKMAERNEVETQREIVALVRNMACHSRLRPVLIDSGIMNIIDGFRDSVHNGVAKWADEIYVLMQREIALGSMEDFKGGGGIATAAIAKRGSEKDAREVLDQGDREALKAMKPLDACVEWSTWGSKLTKIFAPVLESTPNILEKMVCETNVNEGIVINQAMCLPTAVFVQWRNEMKFIITMPPEHGVLLDSITQEPVSGGVPRSADSIVYAPDDDYQGFDSFAFQVLLGPSRTRACTINIGVDAENGDDYGDHEENSGQGGRNRPKSFMGRLFGYEYGREGSNKDDDYDGYGYADVEEGGVGRGENDKTGNTESETYSE